MLSLAAVRRLVAYTCLGLLSVSDANGVSFHRYQMAVWTFVLGIVFWITVYRELAMPTFNDTLLGLMGISAGTFLGVKTAEAKGT